ncbi:MAG TPA: cytochrome c [Acidiferrobacter sp.]|nr:cytochrome c [Acidiferrobacter sp.]
MAIVLVMLLPARAWATGRSERFRVELALLAHEAKQARVAYLSPHMRAHMRSSLGVLPFLARAYCDEQGQSPTALESRIAVIKKAFRAQRYAQLARDLRRLAHQYPVDFYGILPLRPTPMRLMTGRLLYRRLCRSCHIAGQQNGPIPSLFAMAHGDSQASLVVEIMAGVRGTRATALADPLTSEQVASLATYFLFKDQGGHRPRDTGE